jgi:hypothetical protein
MKKTVLTFCSIVGLGLQVMAQGSSVWTPQATGFATPARGIRDIDITSPTEAWAITYDGSGANGATLDFTRTTNGGTTWTPGTIGSVATGHAFSNLSAFDGNTAWVAMYFNGAAGGGKILKTTDGGVTWVHQSTATYTGAAAFPNVVHMFDANNGWTMGDPNGGYFEMYTTTNGGTTWTRVPQANIPTPSSGEFGTVDVYATAGTNTIYFGSNKGRVFKSINGGVNWTLTGNTTLGAVEDMSFSSPLAGLITEGSDIMRTTDGGVTWTPVANYTGNFYTSDIKYVPGTGNTYVSTGAATGAQGSSYSINGGQTWVDYDNGLQRTALDFFSPTVGFAGGFNTDAVTNGIFKFTSTVINGISDDEFTKNVAVFPNPTSGLLNIKFDNVAGNAVSINVTDVLGRTVLSKTEKVNGGLFSTKLDFNNYTKGVYTLKIQAGEKVSVRKIVIE